MVKKRDELRAAIFDSKSKQRKSKEIELFGQKVDIRQPTVGQVSKMANRTDNVSAIVQILIEYAYVPGTDDKVFEDSDRDSLMDMPTGKWLDDLNKAITELTGINVETDVKN